MMKKGMTIIEKEDLTEEKIETKKRKKINFAKKKTRKEIRGQGE